MPAPIVSEASSPAVEPVTPSLTAPDPGAPIEQQLRVELGNADLAIDEIDSFIHVCNFALRHWDRVREARDRIQSAIDLLPEAS